MKLIIGSRGSQLALTQSKHIQALLKKVHPDLEISIQIIKTEGDRLQEVSLTAEGGKGLFTKEIEDALLNKEVDLAVHSLKDLPTQLPAGLRLGAVTTREDARDAWISKEGKTLAQLSKGAVVGTSSPRRQAQLRRLRPGIKTVAIRGNVDTRLRKLEEGQVDALLLAAAGLRRLGLQEKIQHTFSVEEILPAPGQGFLGIEIRKEDALTAQAVACLHDLAASRAAAAERGLLEGLQAGCQAPLGAYAREENGKMKLTGIVCDGGGGEEYLLDSVEGSPDQAEALGAQLASAMLLQGAKVFLSNHEK